MYIQTFFLLLPCLSFAVHAWRIKVEANVAQLHLVSLMFSLNSGHQADEQACTPACSLDDSCLRGGKKAAGVEKGERKKNATCQTQKLFFGLCLDDANETRCTCGGCQPKTDSEHRLEVSTINKSSRELLWLGSLLFFSAL